MKQGIVLAVEDGHELFADNLEATRLAEHITVDGGSVSVALVVTAPDAELAHYGGSTALRNALAETNCVPMGSNARHMLRVLGKAS
jgi:hypothetical protein